MAALMANMGHPLDIERDYEDHAVARHLIKELKRGRTQLNEGVTNPEDKAAAQGFDMLENEQIMHRRQARHGKVRQFDFPEPNFPAVVNVGNVTGVTKLD